MSFSSRRRNYLLTPHRRDGLIEWMKEMLTHSFVLDALDDTGADTFSHFEMLIEEHRLCGRSPPQQQQQPSRLQQLVPTVGRFHTSLPLRRAFLAYNHKYAITSRKHVSISFNEIRHILNLAQIMSFGGHGGDDDGEDEVEVGSHCSDDEVDHEDGHEKEDTSSTTNHHDTRTPQRDDYDDMFAQQWSQGEDSPSSLGIHSSTTTLLRGPQMITFDGDQTLYSDGANFESNPKLANYLYLLLRHGVTVAVVTAAGYEYQATKYEFRLSGLLAYFRQKRLSAADAGRFYLFGGECNYLLRLELSDGDYSLRPVDERGPGGWMTSTAHLPESPARWSERDVRRLLDAGEAVMASSRDGQKLRARLIRKRRSVGLVPESNDHELPREALDETVLRVQAALVGGGSGTTTTTTTLPFCAFNGGRDCWIDVGNKRVGVQILQSYLGISPEKTLHIGDQFLNTGNDYAARDVCPCVWITSPEETTYILKNVLRLAGVTGYQQEVKDEEETKEVVFHEDNDNDDTNINGGASADQLKVNFAEMEKRTKAVMLMDVYTGEIKNKSHQASLT